MNLHFFFFFDNESKGTEKSQRELVQNLCRILYADFSITGTTYV